MIRNPLNRHPAAAPVRFRNSIRRHLLAGAALAVALVAGIGGWAATAEVSGAVIASGSLVADSRVKSVQHPTGGVVGEILVEDGDRVEAGELLVRLDDTVTRAALAIVANEIDHLAVRAARFAAERDGAAALSLPPAIAARAAEAEIAAIIGAETKVFETRRAARENWKAQLRERRSQLEQELVGYDAQEAANAAELALIEDELATSETLRQQQLALKSAHLALQRNLARLQGIAGQVEAAKAQLRGKVTEIDLQVLQIDRDLASEASEELRAIDRRITELQERRIAAEDSLRRTEIRAPEAGTIHQSKVHTVGGVIAGDGAPVMLIVPDGEPPAVEVRVAPQDIDQVRVGGGAILRFPAFSQRTTPEIPGTVDRVSADTSTDPVTGAPYYTIRVAVGEEEIARLGEIDLAPGMPVEAFIRTGDRTVLSHLMKPLSDQFERAFRQD